MVLMQSAGGRLAALLGLTVMFVAKALRATSRHPRVSAILMAAISAMQPARCDQLINRVPRFGALKDPRVQGCGTSRDKGSAAAP